MQACWQHDHHSWCNSWEFVERYTIALSTLKYYMYICSGFCGVCERNIGWRLAQVICIACIQEGDGFLWYQFVIPTTVYINLNTSVFGPFQLTLKLLVLFLPLQSVGENKHMDDEFARVHISHPLC